MRRAPHAPLRASLLAAAVVCAALPAAAQDAPGAEPGAAAALDPAAERFVRNRLEEGRSLLLEGRLEAAELAVRRGLARAPEAAELHTLLARVLERADRTAEAAGHRARAAEISPPPPALPSHALAEKTRGLHVVLLPPPADPEAAPARAATDWPDGEARAALERRLAVRLPDATVELADPETVTAARSWLAERDPAAVITLRVERAYCADTVKDGFFAVARLRGVAETAGGATTAGAGAPLVEIERILVTEPQDRERCAGAALARALERTLAQASVRRAWRARAGWTRPDGGSWSRESMRTLFPGIGERIDAMLALGRTQLASGHVAAAAETFRRAALIDPEDPAARTYVAEAEATLAMSAELAHVGAAGPAIDPGFLDPRFSPAQRAAAEARLAIERQRRADLLAAQEVLEGGVEAPSPETLAALRSAAPDSVAGFGPERAIARAPQGIETRVALAPDGREIARYYLPRGGGPALMREEDLDANGAPDRWIAYAQGRRSEIWEDGRGRGTPDLHFVYAPDGEIVDRVELDTSGDGHFDRVFDYAGGELRGESRDTDEDGVLDQFVRFDAEGRVASREEDLDNDGLIDARATYSGGRLLERTYRDSQFQPDDT